MTDIAKQWVSGTSKNMWKLSEKMVLLAGKRKPLHMQLPFKWNGKYEPLTGRLRNAKARTFSTATLCACFTSISVISTNPKDKLPVLSSSRLTYWFVCSWSGSYVGISFYEFPVEWSWFQLVNSFILWLDFSWQWMTQWCNEWLYAAALSDIAHPICNDLIGFPCWYTYCWPRETYSNILITRCQYSKPHGLWSLLTSWLTGCPW